MARKECDSAMLVLNQWHTEPEKEKNIMEDIIRWMVQHKGWSGRIFSKPKNALLLSRSGNIRFCEYQPREYFPQSAILSFQDLAKKGILDILDYPTTRGLKGNWIELTDFGRANPSSAFRLNTPYMLRTTLDIFNGLNVVGDEAGTSNGYPGFFLINMEYNILSKDQAREKLIERAKNFVPPQTTEQELNISRSDLDVKIRYKNTVIYHNGLWTKFKTS